MPIQWNLTMTPRATPHYPGAFDTRRIRLDRNIYLLHLLVPLRFIECL